MGAAFFVPLNLQDYINPIEAQKRKLVRTTVPEYLVLHHFNLKTKTNTMQLHIKLTNINYPGVVGGKLAVTVTIGKASTKFNVSLSKIGNNPRNITVYLKDVTGSGKIPFPISVTAEDNNDKFKEKGTGSKTFGIDAGRKDVEQFEKVDVPITEVRTADGKPQGKATLVFSFSAVVSEADTSCRGTGKITPVAEVKETLSIGEISAGLVAETRIQPNSERARSVIITGCLYKAGLDWKVKPVSAKALIRWGVNTSLFTEIIFPGNSGATVQCRFIDEVIDSLEFRIKDLNRLIKAPENAPATFYNKPYWASSAVYAAHEKFHIEDLSKAIKTTWKDIETRINIEILGSVKSLTRTNAETKMNNYLLKAENEWYSQYSKIDSSHIPGYKKEVTLNQALLTKARQFKKGCSGKK